MRENLEKFSRAGRATDDSMAHAHCMLDTQVYKHILSEYILLVAFPLQQCLHKRASMLRYTYIAFLVPF